MTGRIYTMPDAPGLLNFGIAHKGAADDNNDLLPVTVTTNVNYEWPEPRPQSEEVYFFIIILFYFLKMMSFKNK